MQTLNLKTTAAVTVYEDVILDIPFFSVSGDGTKWICVIDENTAIRMVIINDYINIMKEKPTDGFMAGKILEAKKEFHSCTESQFIQKYDEVIESISKNTLLEV